VGVKDGSLDEARLRRALCAIEADHVVAGGFQLPHDALAEPAVAARHGNAGAGGSVHLVRVRNVWDWAGCFGLGAIMRDLLVGFLFWGSKEFQPRMNADERG
jgi:hypothetical protein